MYSTLEIPQLSEPHQFDRPWRRVMFVVALMVCVSSASAFAQLITNGTYTITNKASGLVLDDDNNSTTEGADIDQWANNGGNNQKWQLTNLGSNYVELVNVTSNYALEVYNQSQATGAAIDQWPYNGGNNQKWLVVSKGSGEYELVNENSGQALDDPGSSTTQGEDMDQWTTSGNNNQLWSFTSSAPTLVANGTYFITNKTSGLVLDDYNNSTTEGTDIDQWANNGGSNQKWTLTNLGNNYVELANVLSGYALEVYGASTANNAAIDQWPYDSGKNQIWHLVSKGSGEYQLVNENSGLALDDASSSTKQGTYIIQYTADSNTNQLWSFSATTGGTGGGGGSAAATVTINQSSSGPSVTNQILGLNMAYWYDQSNSAIVPAFENAGIKAVRWPGGSGADGYHWQTNTECGNGYTFPAAAWTTWLNDVVDPSGVDVAVTANYGTNAACTGPGDPSEAAAWVTSAKNNGNHVSHWTVGNEVYGSWETDLHTKPNDAATYANAVATGYYPQMKAANSDTLVGVVVEPGESPAWDSIVLSQAKYDFVEYHYYAQAPGDESDTFLVQQAAQQLTTQINAVKADLSAAGHSSTPIYLGELGSVYGQPGVQSSSITQALFAGQVLGEAMNDGVSRATWWIGFGGCDESGDGDFNFSSSLYGWQNYGGYMVFSDGLPEGGCTGTPTVAAGTMLPTARAFQLFSRVAVNGEHVLTNSVSGDTTDVRAYSATNDGGTAIVVFNLNENNSETVQLKLSSQTSASSVTVETYNKSIYDQSKSNVWAPPTTSNLGSQSLPLTLTLTPWSMNVVIIH